VKLQGALLIGGRSRRMGRPKSQMPINGTTWGGYLCELLQEVTGQVPVLLGEGSIGPSDDLYRRVPDREVGAGPLSGLLGFFDACPKQDLLLLATDMPLLNMDALSWLIDQAERTECHAVWPRFSERDIGEPLGAIYRHSVRNTLEAAWLQGLRGPVRALPAELRFEPVIPDPYRVCFSNFNSPNEVERSAQK